MIADFLLGFYLWLKALHLLAVIALFAGLMYLPRLFIYHHQAEKGGETEGYFIAMERRLLKGIMNPSIAVVWIVGLLMVWANTSVLSAGWFHVKLLFVIILSGIHGFYASAQRKFAAGERPRSEKFWRIMNEAPFVALIVIVIMVIVKPL